MKARIYFEENLHVYDALRNEMLRCEDLVANNILAMYISYATLFVLGFRSRLFFVASLVVLVVFQDTINKNQLACTKIAIFIRVFFEEPSTGIHWESFHQYSKYKKYHEPTRIISKLFTYRSSIYLAALSLTTLFYLILFNPSTSSNFNTPIKLFYSIISIILFFFVFYINIEFNEKFDSKDLEKCIRDYYSYVNFHHGKVKFKFPS